MGFHQTVRIAGWKSFLADEGGGATIELVVWTPFIFAILFLVVDVSVALWRYGEMWSATRRAARAYAIGALSSEAEVGRFVAGALVSVGGTSTTVDEDFAGITELIENSTVDAFSVTTTLPARRLTVVGVLEFIVPSLSVTVVMTREPGVT